MGRAPSYPWDEKSSLKADEPTKGQRYRMQKATGNHCIKDLRISLEVHGMDMNLCVKDSGVKATPQSDLREGYTSRLHNKEKRRVKHSVRVGSWNVRTLLQRGKLENAKQEMTRNRLDILGLSEVRWGGNGECNSGDFRLYYSGEEKSGSYGVGILVGRRIKGSVVKAEYINERIIMIRIKAKDRDLVVIQVYMPTSGHKDEEIEECYDKIENIIEKESRNACVLVMGDWNAVVGEGKDGMEVGNFGLGVRNERGQRMVEFCRENGFVVSNTLFENHKRRRYTWTSPLDGNRYQIDYILVQKRYRNCVKNARSYPGADICSDHNLVLAEVCVRLKRTAKGKKKEEIDIDKLKVTGTSVELEKIFVKNLGGKETTLCVDEKWENIKNSLKKAAKETLGVKKGKRKKKEWITEEMLEKMNERRKWKNVSTEEGKRKYRKLNNELRRETDKAREQWTKEKCDDIERLEKEGRYDLMHKVAMELVFKERSARSGIEIELKDGCVVDEMADVKKRWKEYVEELYDWKNKPNEKDLEIEIEEEVTVEEKGYNLLEEEIEASIKEMKCRKATGSDELPVELLKALNGEGKEVIRDLCNHIYQEGKWPKDFRETIMIPIPKKRNTKRCEEHRTLSLISHTAKVILRTINRRLYSKLNMVLSEEQYGFRKGVGTRDAIGLLRVIGERFMEKGRKVYAVFVDMEKAFDCVRWNILMKLLRKYGIDWSERRLIADLYMNQKVKVRIGEELTEEIGMGRGVRQGCCISPTLFNIYLEEIIEDAFDGTRGVTIGGRKIECIRFADDQVILAESKEEVKEMLSDLNRKCLEYGMKINKKKTKCMIIGGKEESLRMEVEGVEIQQVKEYKYLGSIITEDMRCSKEIKVRMAMAREGFKRKRGLLCGPMNKKLRKRLAKCYIWSVALYGAETWTLRKEDERRIEALEMWIWRKMEGVSWDEKVRNEEVLKRIGEDRQILNKIKSRKMNWLGHVMRRECLLRTVVEGMVEGRRGRGRRRYQLIDNIKVGNMYETTKRTAQRRDEWREAMREPALGQKYQ